MVSGRGSPNQLGGIVYEKENLIITGSRGVDDDNVNRITEEAQHQYGIVVPSWSFSDALTENTEEDGKKRNAFDIKIDYFDGDSESRGRSTDHTLAETNSGAIVECLDKYFDRQPSWKSLVEPNHSKSPHLRQSLSISENATPSRYNPSSRVNYMIEDTPLVSNALRQFLSHAPTWAARAAERRIEFWSELTEKQQMSSNVLATDTLFSAHNVDCDVANYSRSCWEWDESCTVPKLELTKFRSMYLPEWVVSYLDDISLRLREGGWDEDDIDEIMDTPPTTLSEMDDKQAVVDALSRQARILSSSLRKGGWSMRDAAEVLNVDLTLGDHSNLQVVTTTRRNLSHAQARLRTTWQRKSY